MLYRCFLVLLLSVLVIILLLVFLPVPELAAGTSHPSFSTMMKGGNSIVDLGFHKWLGLLLGLSVVGLYGFSILSATGKSNPRLSAAIRSRMILGICLYLLTFLVLVILHWYEYGTGALNLFGGFPRDTAWMLFVLSLVPLYFTFWYVQKFYSWIITSEELSTFQAMVDRRNAEHGS